ncbi:MAG TPA: DUF3536 domain-containing protein, partial [Bryobacteraceae bacterium]|nr:DUF3536 domain-containing protein [Bryobacteraceae bacterium]
QSQAHLVRRIGASEWVDVTGGRIDPTRAYQYTTPSGKKIALFFYDGPISRAVAFEGLLNNGEIFAQRLLSAYSANRSWEELAHIATDGESYGHHHRYGEMALSYALHHVETNKMARLTNYGQFLEIFPPTHEVEVYENTAWSCAHGVGRWIRDCGCNSGGHGGWNQQWRGPLRAALDWLRDEVTPKYEASMAELVKDPWDARNDYVHVVLDRSEANRKAFLEKHAARSLKDAEQVRLWKLLELQRHAMLMYTSCGWFFDELSGIETVQVIQYAGRVLQLSQEIFEQSPEILYAARKLNIADDEDSLEARFLQRLFQAKSNVPEHRDGAAIYEKFVRPAIVNLRKVGAHYAISSVFNQYPEEARIYCYTVKREHLHTADTGKLRLVIGRARFVSEITQDAGVITFGVLYFGDHNLHGGVREFRGPAEYERLVQESKQAFSRADIPEIIRAFDRGFGLDTYSLKSLFRDEQRNILSQILLSTVTDAEAVYRQLYENHAPLMRFLNDLRTPLPKAFRTTAEYALNSHLRRAFSAENLDIERVRNLLNEVSLSGVDLDSTTLEFTLRKSVERAADRLRENPLNLTAVRALRNSVDMLDQLPFSVTLWAIQNVCYDVLQDTYPSMTSLSAQGDEKATTWVQDFRALAAKLSLRVA